MPVPAGRQSKVGACVGAVLDLCPLSFRSGLQQMFGLLQFSLSSRLQPFACSVNEELNHASAGAETTWTNLLAGHDSRDSGRVLGEQTFGRVGRHCFYFADPEVLLRVPHIHRSVLK